jgi:hypothetical protein
VKAPLRLLSALNSIQQRVGLTLIGWLEGDIDSYLLLKILKMWTPIDVRLTVTLVSVCLV